MAAEQPEYIKKTEVFPDEVVKEGFDIVVTNPPYKNKLKRNTQKIKKVLKQ